jgi:HAD superfamily hydrolase (TIGR01509 family)
MPDSQLRGIVFDMDGTLIDSALDFSAMRSEMGLAENTPILESLLHMPLAQRLRCEEILHRHEWAGAHRAVPMPGAVEFLAALDQRQIPRAVLTRNGRELTLAVLSRLQMEFEIVLTRDDGPTKPNPAVLLALCETWGFAPAEVAMIGDFHYDIRAGSNAGTRTVLYTAGQDLSHFPWAAEADVLLHSFHEAEELLFGKP